MKPHAYLITDGSCSKTGVGAWAGLCIVPNTSTAHVYGACNYTTINRCELHPIIDGLRYIRATLGKKTRGLRICIISDSESTIKTIDGHYQPKANNDLWLAYFDLAKGFNITTYWLSRNTHPYMVYADGLAYALRHKVLEHSKVLDNMLPEPNLELEELP